MAIADPASPASARTFLDDRALLLEVLLEVVQDDEAMATHDRAVALARRARDGEQDAAEELAGLVADLDVPEAELLVRSLSRWFQLVNLAEDNERIRRVQAREVREAPAPRAGSLRQAVAVLRDRGASAQDVRAVLERAEVRLVLTAHPTEARRRTTLEKLARIFTMLRDLDERPGVPGTIDLAKPRLRATIQELWHSDELRAVSPTVLDEVRAGLVYFVSTLADVVPQTYRDLEAALEACYPDDDLRVPPLLTFGSWIGGDRDGNPFVTPEVTLEALEVMRDQCLRFLEARVALLAGRVSLSERLAGPAPGLHVLLDEGERTFPELAEQLRALNPEEPYRRALTFVRERVQATRRRDPEGYDHPAELLEDLRTVERALLDGGGELATGGDLRDVIRQVEVFGFHFARLDVRQHAKRHRSALDELLRELQVCDGYGELDEEERLGLLTGWIDDRRPIIPSDISGFSDETREVIETFRMLRGAVEESHRGAVETYIVSGTEGPADLMEVLFFLKEEALAKPGGEQAALRIVPLFEAGATLAAGAATMERVLACPPFRRALAAVGDEQEVMIGYSDSNKDVGYVASGWATYHAQVEIAEALERHGASWVFFHGRGGAVGRGGGPTNVAILALPPSTVNARLKMTEQGEVLAAKYGTAPVAHRELELTTAAALVSALGGPRFHPDPERLERFEAVLDRMAERSAEAYRALVHDDPDFVTAFAQVTPVDEISRLRLGSRPAKRRSDGGIDDLRAIPWVFSWTQARIVLPAWFGLGTALQAAREDVGLDTLREMAADWPFFAALLANAEMACAKADLPIARRYFDLWEDEEPRERLWGVIGDEFALTRAELLQVRDEERLLDRDPVLQASIDRRNPYVDPLSFLQVALLRRLRAEPGEADPDLARLSLLTVNGIAAGLRNTG